MKATGIVRRIDDLGRVVVPKEIRRTLRIREGDPLEIFTDKDGSVLLRKYSPIGELSENAKELAEALALTFSRTAIICDKDSVISAAGSLRREYELKSISAALEEAISERRPHIKKQLQDDTLSVYEGEDTSKVSAQVMFPILSQGQTIGAVVLVSKDGTTLSEGETKGVQLASEFLGAQMAD